MRRARVYSSTLRRLSSSLILVAFMKSAMQPKTAKTLNVLFWRFKVI